MPVLGEEMGFIGFVAVIGLYGFLAFRGLQIAAREDGRFAKAMALGLSVVFAFSTFINVGVALACSDQGPDFALFELRRKLACHELFSLWPLAKR